MVYGMMMVGVCTRQGVVEVKEEDGRLIELGLGRKIGDVGDVFGYVVGSRQYN